MYSQFSIEQLVNGFRRGELCLDTWQQALRERHGNAQHLNSFITFDPAMLAYVADADRQAPLYGLPVSFKDNINVLGMPTTAGTPGLADYLPQADAGIVARFKQLGARVVGKNNMHELSFGVTSANHTHGAVINPTNERYSAGGSSGGCAAAVAAGLVPCAVGTDTGGSVRIPAAFCGIVGLRPTTGGYPADGIVPVSQTKDTPGLLTRTVEDCRFVHGHLTAHHLPALPTNHPLRIGIPERFLWSDLDDNVSRDCRAAIDTLAASDVQIVPVDDSVIGELNECIQFPLPIYEFFIDFPRFLMKEGRGAEFLDILARIEDPGIKKILTAQLESPAISYTDYVQALMGKVRLEQEYRGLFTRHRLDLMAYPTVSCSAPLLEDCAMESHFERFVRNTDPASNLAAPSITIPVAAADALPVGLSFDALPGQDGFLLQAVSRLAQRLNIR
ncbi:amidase family protein [Pseudomonas botevensis]|uniref:amidase family protein n=1 Tax=Pseudomonas botevensis TaxID=2842352 RepID=UPI001C3E0937|nr:amidase family protein [Pseudomonas botevensis]MBV4477140.1 indole acetimide hydrolase [Pseudomonas botevensis]